MMSLNYKMTRFSVVLGATLALALVGCGDDDPAGPTAGTGGGGGGEAGTAGSDAGSGGSDAGSGGNGAVTKADCIAAGHQGLGEACLDCACEAAPAAVSVCDETCWGLVRCIVQECPGLVDAARTSCAIEYCDEFLEGAGGAEGVRDEEVVPQCASETVHACVPFLQEGASGEGDAGVDDAGIDDAGLEDAGVDAG